MSATDELRLAASLAQCEMALVRRDPVASPLLAQAARHAEGMPGGEMVALAARLARGAGAERSASAEAVRKAVQALCRAALVETEAALLRRAP